jgi:integrase/recombinase XerD
LSGTVVLREKWPVLARHEQAATWLQIWADLGRAPRTIDAYGLGLAEYLLLCEREGVDPVTANRAHVAVFVRELTSRPHRRGANVVSIDSGAGLANAATPTQWAGAAIPPAAGRAGCSAAWCRG